MPTPSVPMLFPQVRYDNARRGERRESVDSTLLESKRLLQVLEQDDGYLAITTPQGVFVEFKTLDPGQFWIEIWHDQYSGTFTSAQSAGYVLERALVDFGGIGPKDDLSFANIEWLY